MKRADPDSGRVAVIFSRENVPPSLGTYARSLLLEEIAAGVVGKARKVADDGHDDVQDDAQDHHWSRFKFGTTTNAVVVAIKEYGVVLRAAEKSNEKGVKPADAGSEFRGQLMVCPREHVPEEGVEEGLSVKVSSGRVCKYSYVCLGSLSTCSAITVASWGSISARRFVTGCSCRPLRLSLSVSIQQ